MTDFTKVEYSFHSLLARYAAKDIFRALEDKIMPGSFQPNNRYDELLHDDVLGFVMHHPLFAEWRNTLVLNAEVSAVRIGNSVPVIETGYNISIDEARALYYDANVIYGFMRSMAQSLTDRAIPYEEAFACILDAMFTSQYVMGTRLDKVH